MLNLIYENSLIVVLTCWALMEFCFLFLDKDENDDIKIVDFKDIFFSLIAAISALLLIFTIIYGAIKQLGV